MTRDAQRKPHLVVVQYGDYGLAWRRLAEGLPETYRDQKESVAFMARLTDRFRVTTLSICDRPHREELAPDLWSVGILPQVAWRARGILPLLAGLGPDRMILRTPLASVLLWARMRRLPTLPCFADLFSQGGAGLRGLRRRLGNRLLAGGLSGGNVVCVSNHSRNASVSLQTVLGLPAGRIVPWDQAALIPGGETKPPAPMDRPFRAFYAGLIMADKGIGDCLEAAASLAAGGMAFEIDFVGEGDLEVWRARAEALGLEARARFLGKRPNAEVRERMREADLVLVPSRHLYPEGLPNTLCEALAARTPVVVSDHPAFASRLQGGRDVVMFRAGDPGDLAAQIRLLRGDADLQARLSETGPAVLAGLRYGMDWFDLMRAYIEDPGNATGWVQAHSLAALG